MTSIQRFTPDYKMHAVRFEAFAREAEHGELVQFDDHQQVVSALKAERDALADRVNALAVENQALKARSIKLFNLGYLRGHESTVEGYFVDVHWCDIDTYHDDVVAEIIEDEDETPSTSAALAAIQAQGVEKALAVVSACRENICPGGLSENRQYEESIVQPHLDGIADELGNLIIELREAK
ncbi:hypothetical protein [Serratia marcescens]|uniref:hypothetical protein n=1 Tax=Serratia marcescens TaxID=615 RepID=UPI000B5E9A66|nr:hypothetical protein [Serratia marcescens]ASM11825.1 hypothetical protein BVG93_07725 [Serratia marcescens]